jgi:hypothetical protein
VKTVVAILLSIFAFGSIAMGLNVYEFSSRGVPEPATAGLIGMGLVALAIGARVIRDGR